MSDLNPLFISNLLNLFFWNMFLEIGRIRQNVNSVQALCVWCVGLCVKYTHIFKVVIVMDHVSVSIIWKEHSPLGDCCLCTAGERWLSHYSTYLAIFSSSEPSNLSMGTV